jgi:hypothetical protein
MSELTVSVESVTIKGVRYPVEIDEGKPEPGGLGVDRGGARWANANGKERGQVLTRGPLINVPLGTVLVFQLKDPIRLRGYRSKPLE